MNCNDIMAIIWFSIAIPLMIGLSILLFVMVATIQGFLPKWTKKLLRFPKDD